MSMYYFLWVQELYCQVQELTSLTSSFGDDMLADILIRTFHAEQVLHTYRNFSALTTAIRSGLIASQYGSVCNDAARTRVRLPAVLYIQYTHVTPKP